jgi:hypothetical protein
LSDAGGNSRSSTEFRLFHADNASSPRQATVSPSQIDMFCMDQLAVAKHAAAEQIGGYLSNAVLLG